MEAGQDPPATAASTRDWARIVAVHRPAEVEPCDEMAAAGCDVSGVILKPIRSVGADHALPFHDMAETVKDRGPGLANTATAWPLSFMALAVPGMTLDVAITVAAEVQIVPFHRV